jgi:hypothetical protein
MSAIELVQGLDAIRPNHLEPGCLPRKPKSQAMDRYQNRLRQWPFIDSRIVQPDQDKEQECPNCGRRLIDCVGNCIF